MNEKEIQAILKRYRQGLCTDVERTAVEAWIAEELQKGDWRVSPDRKSQLKRALKQQIDQRRLATSRRFVVLRPGPWKVAIAAAAVLLIVGIIVFLNLDQKATPASAPEQPVADLAPGSNRATLRLADGRTIPLSENQSGIVINDQAIRYADGTKLSEEIAEAAYAVLGTPQGGQYQVTLPDGTKVWLNAASTLRYFTSAQPKKERRVVLRGEAYFEVAKMDKLPFIVETQQQEIRVWGTHFNVNAYSDEPTTKTTLLEGSVSIQVKGKTAPVYLKPNQQAQVHHGDIRISHTTTETAVAWKNGYFMFDDEPIESIMRKVSRWYNVDVVFRNVNKQQVFTGTVSRFEQVSKVLEKLELTGGVRFEIEAGTTPEKGRRIIVMP